MRRGETAKLSQVKDEKHNKRKRICCLAVRISAPKQEKFRGKDVYRRFRRALRGGTTLGKRFNFSINLQHEVLTKKANRYGKIHFERRANFLLTAAKEASSCRSKLVWRENSLLLLAQKNFYYIFLICIVVASVESNRHRRERSNSYSLVCTFKQRPRMVLRTGFVISSVI